MDPRSHPTPKLNQNNQNPGRIPGNVEHWLESCETRRRLFSHPLPVCTQPHLSLLVILRVLLERRRPIEVRTEEHHRFRRQRATRLAVPCTSHKQPASQPVASACGVARGACLLARTSTSPARRLYQPSPAGGASSGCSLTCPGCKERTSWATTAPRDALPSGDKRGQLKQGCSLTVAPSSRSAAVAAARAALIRPAAGSASSSVPASGGGGGRRRRRGR